MEISEKLRRELDILEYKGIAHQNDYDMVFSLYKHFIDAGAPFYTSGCSCKNSIEKYYNALITWWKNYKIEEVNIKIDTILDTKDGSTEGQDSQTS